MLVTKSCYMAETRTNTTPHSTKRSADFTSPAWPWPTIRRNVGSTSQASSSSFTYSLLMVSPSPLRKSKGFKTPQNPTELRSFLGIASTAPVSSGTIPPSLNPFASSHAVMQLRNGSNRRLTRSTAPRPRSLQLQQCRISHHTKRLRSL